MKRIVVVLVLAGLWTGSAATVSASATPLASYFPASSDYPAGFSTYPVQHARVPDVLFTGADLQWAGQRHFQGGASQISTFLSSDSASFVWASIIVVRFRTARGASWFRTHGAPPIYGPTAQRNELVPSLGVAGALYSEGQTAPCPSITESALSFNCGNVFVRVLVQPSNRPLAVKLATVVDARITGTASG